MYKKAFVKLFGDQFSLVMVLAALTLKEFILFSWAVTRIFIDAVMVDGLAFFSGSIDYFLLFSHIGLVLVTLNVTRIYIKIFLNWIKADIGDYSFLSK